MLTHKRAAVTDGLHIANIFNDYFSSITEKNIFSIKFLNKFFQDLIHHSNEELLLIAATDVLEVNLKISSPNGDKFTGSNRLPN